MGRRNWIVVGVFVVIGVVAAIPLLTAHRPRRAADANAAIDPARVVPIAAHDEPSTSSPNEDQRSAATPVAPNYSKPAKPLPPAGTPLKQIQVELAARAASGDAAAASRLFRDTYECVRFHYMLQDATREHSEPTPVNEGTLDGLNETARRLHRSEPLCAGIDAEINDGRIYRITLRAAELGDLEAACAYVNAPILFGRDGRFGEGSSDVDDAGGAVPDLRDEDLVAEYKQRAIELGDAGVLRGDWNMVEALRLAFGTWPGPVPFANPFAPNPALEYRYEVLWMLGENESTALQISPPEGLSAQQIAEAQSWAQATYRKYFAPRARDSTGHLCGISPLTGLQ